MSSMSYVDFFNHHYVKPKSVENVQYAILGFILKGVYKEFSERFTLTISVTYGVSMLSNMTERMKYHKYPTIISM
jgi:hypothetical protein